MRVAWVLVAVVCAGCASDGRGTSEVSSEPHDGGTSNPPADDARGSESDEATLVMQPFTVDPGAEVFVCQVFANPFDRDVFIHEFETHMSVGSHHLVVNDAKAKPPSDIEPCSGLIAPTGPFATQVPDDKYTYQAGVGARLEAASSLRFVSHYLNTSGQTISPRVAMTLRLVPAGQSVRLARMTSWNSLALEIPPHQEQTVSLYGGLGIDAEMLWLLPHMHSRGKHFEVSIGETDPVTIFETNDWESAPHRFDPPLHLGADDRVNYTCTWANDTDNTLTFGESAATNEMCLLAFQYVPDDPDQ